MNFRSIRPSAKYTIRFFLVIRVRPSESYRLSESDHPAVRGVLECVGVLGGRAERGEAAGEQGGAAAGEQRRRIAELVAENDGPFKHHLERVKYANRYPGEDPSAHRQAALAILRRWNSQLEEGAAGGGVGKGWLLGPQSCLADWALLPFVRQFRIADPADFDATVGIGALQAWLARFEAGGELAAVMAPPLAPRHPWRSPSWLYHLALAEEWRDVEVEGVYRRSTRGLSIEQVGYLHASHGDQIAATFERFYADARLAPGAGLPGDGRLSARWRRSGRRPRPPRGWRGTSA